MILTQEFLSQYDSRPAPFTELGRFVYYRTYSRWLEEQGRRETWQETCARAVEYNVGLAKKHLESRGMYYDLDSLRSEAETLYDNLFNLRQFLSGRTLWVGGTPVAEKFPLANFNCAFLILDSFEDFVELFYLLMVGTGVGFRVLPADVNKIPTYRQINVEFEDYISALQYAPKRLDLTSLHVDCFGTATIVVGDSKEGWVSALKYYFELISSPYYRDVTKIIVNFDNVRPKGERLKTFGGTASGYESLYNMFNKIAHIMERAGGKLQPIDALDIANIIGENVVVGGVRRTSEIGIFDAQDVDIRTAKDHIYFIDDQGNWQENKDILHRRMSNNSIFYEQKPSRDELRSIMQSIKVTGEPAFINVAEMRRRRSDGEGLNPCAEVLLADKQTCNLTTINMMAFVQNDSAESECQLDVTALVDAVKLSVRSALRTTLVELELPDWNAQQKKDRLLGCSITGWQDMVDALELDMVSRTSVLRLMRGVAHDEAERYAQELGINTPLLVTTVKPEGTLSQLPTVSSGLHWAHSPYFIRRVRINAHDPLVRVAEELGWHVKPEIGQDWDTCNTKVIEFPVQSPAKRTKYDISAIEQLENYKMFMEHYVDHNASITVTVNGHEWDEVEEWLWNNWESVVAVSFLSLDDHNYPLAPYEAISQQRYNELMQAYQKPFTPEILQQYEKRETEIALEGAEGCESGACPIR